MVAKCLCKSTTFTLALSEVLLQCVTEVFYIMDNIKILQWNCNGLRSRIDDIKQLLIHNFDIICLQETRLTNNCKFSIPGYNILRKDRPNGQLGEGQITAIKKNLFYDKIDNLAIYSLELLTIQMILDNEPVIIVNLYRKPETYTDLQTWDTLLQHINTINSQKVICGDFNAHSNVWSSNNNPSGATLTQALNNTYLIVLNDPDTCTIRTRPGWTPGSPDISIVETILAIKCE